MKPKVSRRSAAIASGERPARSRPSTRRRPLLGLSRQPSKFISVDLPEPEAPMMATISPASMERLTPSSARTCVPPAS